MSLFLGESDGRRVELPPDAVTQSFGILGIPGEQTRAVVAAHLDCEAKGGAFQAAVSRLLTLGLVTTVGKRGLRASDDLLGSAT